MDKKQVKLSQGSQKADMHNNYNRSISQMIDLFFFIKTIIAFLTHQKVYLKHFSS